MEITFRKRKELNIIMKIAKKEAFISSYPPGKCGTATFTSDLIANIKLASEGEFDPVIYAMDLGDKLD